MCPSAEFHRAAALRAQPRPPCCRHRTLLLLVELRVGVRGRRVTKSVEVRDGGAFFVWRRVATTLNDGSREYKTGWVGPAIVVTFTTSKNTGPAHVCGVLFKRAINQVRPGTNQQSLGAATKSEVVAASDAPLGDAGMCVRSVQGERRRCDGRIHAGRPVEPHGAFALRTYRR